MDSGLKAIIQRVLGRFKGYAVSSKQQLITLACAIILPTVCVVALSLLPSQRFWLTSLAAAIFASAILSVIWEFHWHRVLVKERPPEVKGQLDVTLALAPPKARNSPLMVLPYDKAKELCECGLSGVGSGLLSLGSGATLKDLKIDPDFVVCIAELRKEDLLGAAREVKIVFNRFTGTLVDFVDNGNSSLHDVLKAVPDLINKLSSFAANAFLPVAHYLSNRDNSKKLRKILAELRQICQNRMLDQEMKLKSIYQQVAIELSSVNPFYPAIHFSIYRFQLLELLNTWKEEMKVSLRNAPSCQEWTLKGRELESCRRMVEGLAPRIQLFYLGLFVQLSLVFLTGSLDEFHSVIGSHITDFEKISKACIAFNASMIKTALPSFQQARLVEQAVGGIVTLLKNTQSLA